MAIDNRAFERYRRSPNEKTTLFRLIAGIAIVVAFWFGVTFAVIYPNQRLLESPAGVFVVLATFAGMAIGLWVAMRLVHKEKFSRLFGASARISRSGMLNGFLAVLITSLLTEIAYLSIMPGISRGSVSVGAWALLVVPLLCFAFIQTSSEELLFRGYLQRGLACRFRSPLIWGVLPTLVFTSLHWNPASPIAMNIAVVVAIGAFSALLALLVYATGNLGAAMGAHLANNFTGFALISHDTTLGGFALLQAPPLDGLAWTPAETAMIAGISIVSILLTWLLLLHPRSPLRVKADLGHPPGETAAILQEPGPNPAQP